MERHFSVYFLFTLMGMLGFGLNQSRSWADEETFNIKTQEDIIKEGGAVFAEVSRLRGLPIKHQVKIIFQNQEFFSRYYQKILEKEYPPEKQIAFEKAYKILGFLPANTDLIPTFLDSFVSSVKGFYDPQTKNLYLADWGNFENQDETLAHELTHALQDQYFDLQSFLDQGDKTMDSQFARSCVMEGEAVAISLNYSLEDKNRDFTQLVNIAQWTQLSDYLEENGARAFGRKYVSQDVIDFPYVYGTSFLQKYIKAYGWQGMEYLFRHPPTSTHQIIHPETFFPIRQDPIRIQIQDLSMGPLSGSNKIWENTLGEYGLFLLLQSYRPDSEARNAVKGWKGDQVQVYETKGTGHLMLVGYILFDNENSASDFFNSYRMLQMHKYSTELFRRTDDSIQWATLENSDKEIYVECFGNRVVVIEGMNDVQIPLVRAALWTVKRLRHKTEFLQTAPNVEGNSP